MSTEDCYVSVMFPGITHISDKIPRYYKQLKCHIFGSLDFGIHRVCACDFLYSFAKAFAMLTQTMET